METTTGKVLGDLGVGRRAFSPSKGLAGMSGRHCSERWLRDSMLDKQKKIRLRHDFQAGHYTNISRMATSTGVRRVLCIQLSLILGGLRGVVLYGELNVGNVDS